MKQIVKKWISPIYKMALLTWLFCMLAWLFGVFFIYGVTTAVDEGFYVLKIEGGKNDQ